MSRKFEHTFRLYSQGRNSKYRKILNEVDDSIVLIQIDEVEGNQNSDGMHTSGGHQPDAFIGAELQSSDEPSQTRKDGISGRY